MRWLFGLICRWRGHRWMRPQRLALGRLTYQLVWCDRCGKTVGSYHE